MQPQTQKDDKKHNGAPAPAKTEAAKPEAKTEAAKPAEKTEGEAPKRESRKVYIVVGEIREFKNAAEAEKFLNTDPTAPKDFAVIKGLKVEKKQKVSLR